jgi:hypothetical protein
MPIMRSAESVLDWPAIHVKAIVTLARSTTTRKGSLRDCEGALGLEPTILVEANVRKQVQSTPNINKRCLTTLLCLRM